MVSIIQIFCLLSVTVAVTSSSSVKDKYRKSHLILEFDWPEPTKNLKRFPHPKSCVHFYHLKPDGSHTIKKCHGGEIFDYQSLQCKEKAFAKCWKDIIQKITSKKRRGHFSCPFPWGLYPDTEDCSQFHECLGGKSFLRKCPAATLFDKAEQTCVSSKDAMCADESDNIQHNSYKCPYKWGFFTHPTDCSKYFECLRKVPSIRTCKRNMLFDNFERRCLPMSRVKCGTRLNPYENGPTTNEQITSRGIETESVRITISPRNKGDISENPKTGSEKGVSVEKPVTGFEKKFFDSRTESKKGTTGNSPTTNEQITLRGLVTENISISPRNIEGDISENPKRGSEKGVSVEKPVTGFEKKFVTIDSKIGSEIRVSAENSKTFASEVSSKYPITMPEERAFTEKLQTKSENNVSTGNTITTFERRVSMEKPKTEFEKQFFAIESKTGSEREVSTEHPKTGYEQKVSTEKSGIRFKDRVSTEHSGTEYEQKVSTKKSGIRFVDRISTEKKMPVFEEKASTGEFVYRVSTEKKMSELGEKASTAEPVDRISTEKKMSVFEEKASTGEFVDRVLIDKKMSEFKEKASTGESRTESERWVSTGNLKTKLLSERVTSEKTRIKYDQVPAENTTIEYIPHSENSKT